MKLIPKTHQEWLSFALLPFKAYTVIAPLLVLYSMGLPRPRHTGATDAEIGLIAGLFPCGVILFVAALILAFGNQKSTAFSCALFGVVGIALAVLLLPAFAHA